MGNSNDKAKHMKVTDLKWHTRDDGETWSLSGDYKGVDAAGVVRRLFEIKYLGRTKGASWGERKMRWKAHDRRYWVDNPQDIPEFLDLDEAKAWVLTIITLEN
jgi:hypothetical protein